MTRILLVLALCLSLIQLAAQPAPSLRQRIPLGFTPSRNTQINGLALGLVHFSADLVPEKINGIGVEIGWGLVLPAFIGRAFSQMSSKEAHEMDAEETGHYLNGLSLSLTGAAHNGYVNGLSLNGIGSMARRMHGAQFAIMVCEDWELKGLSASVFVTDAYRVRGLQMAVIGNASVDHRGVQIGFLNSAKKMRGIQIGVFNKSKNLRGLQIGLWNTNQKRSLPFLNWVGNKKGAQH